MPLKSRVTNDPTPKLNVKSQKPIMARGYFRSQTQVFGTTQIFEDRCWESIRNIHIEDERLNAIYHSFFCSFQSLRKESNKRAMSLLEVWEASAATPFEPFIGKDSQLIVGFTLLISGKDLRKPR